MSSCQKVDSYQKRMQMSGKQSPQIRKINSKRSQKVKTVNNGVLSGSKKSKKAHNQSVLGPRITDT